MPDLLFPWRGRILAAAVSMLGACSVLGPDTSASALKVNADKTTRFQVPLSPDQACTKTARMLSWCANSLNIHYRCALSLGGESSELTAELEAVFRTEFLMDTEFVRAPGGSIATVRQRDSYLVRDYAPIIQKFFISPDCKVE